MVKWVTYDEDGKVVDYHWLLGAGCLMLANLYFCFIIWLTMTALFIPFEFPKFPMWAYGIVCMADLIFLMIWIGADPFFNIILSVW
jgi:hypothetical protein